MTGRSELMSDLQELAKLLDDMEWAWSADVCRRARKEVELLRGIIMNDPVEIQMEEGDRANG